VPLGSQSSHPPKDLGSWRLGCVGVIREKQLAVNKPQRRLSFSTIGYWQKWVRDNNKAVCSNGTFCSSFQSTAHRN
jgi:hypothetical protein